MWTKFASILKDLAKSRNLNKIFARAERYLLSTTDASQESNVRRAVDEIPDQFPKIKAAAMTPGEAIEKRGEAKIIRRQLEKVYPKLTTKELAGLEDLKEETLEHLADAIALQQPIAEIRGLLKGQ